MLAWHMIFGRNRLSWLGAKVLIFPIILYSLTAPFVVVMNGSYPYWDFIFTLILNFSRENPVMGYYGLLAFVVTIIMLVMLVIFTVVIWGRILSEKSSRKLKLEF